MAFSGEYKCSNCNKIEKPDLLTAKKVMFQEIGVKPRTLKSRIVGWYCPPCVAKDPEWNLAPYSSPGMMPSSSSNKVPREKTAEELRVEAIKADQAAYDAAWENADED